MLRLSQCRAKSSNRRLFVIPFGGDYVFIFTGALSIFLAKELGFQDISDQADSSALSHR